MTRLTGCCGCIPCWCIPPFLTETLSLMQITYADGSTEDMLLAAERVRLRMQPGEALPPPSLAEAAAMAASLQVGWLCSLRVMHRVIAMRSSACPVVAVHGCDI